MGEVTAISWCDHTFNPWIGCTKVSPACDGCYAEAMMDLRYGRAKWGPGEDRVRTAPSNWKQPLAWNRAAVRDGSRPFVFCASLADVFDNEVDPAWRRDLFDLIRATPALTWLLLTKRIGNVLKMVSPYHGGPGWLDNAAIGATIINQREMDRDAEKLREARRVLAPAFTFASIEPMLGPIALPPAVFDWVITGGETDQGAHAARPQHPDWFRAIRDQCAQAGAAYHHKQNGEWASIYDRDVDDPDWRRCASVADATPRGQWLNLDGGQGFHGERVVRVDRVGKARAGRLLDGMTHDARPERCPA